MRCGPRRLERAIKTRRRRRTPTPAAWARASWASPRSGPGNVFMHAGRTPRVRGQAVLRPALAQGSDLVDRGQLREEDRECGLHARQCPRLLVALAELVRQSRHLRPASSLEWRLRLDLGVAGCEATPMYRRGRAFHAVARAPGGRSVHAEQLHGDHRFGATDGDAADRLRPACAAPRQGAMRRAQPSHPVLGSGRSQRHVEGSHPRSGQPGPAENRGSAHARERGVRILGLVELVRRGPQLPGLRPDSRSSRARSGLSPRRDLRGLRLGVDADAELRARPLIGPVRRLATC